MRQWDIVWSEDAETDLDSIYAYISAKLLEPVIARNLTGRIKTAIQSLDQMPERFPLYHAEPWRSRGVRQMVAGNYIVLYRPMEEYDDVLILRILYGRRDIDALLQEDDL